VWAGALAVLTGVMSREFYEALFVNTQMKTPSQTNLRGFIRLAQHAAPAGDAAWPSYGQKFSQPRASESNPL